MNIFTRSHSRCSTQPFGNVASDSLSSSFVQYSLCLLLLVLFFLCARYRFLDGVRGKCTSSIATYTQQHKYQRKFTNGTRIFIHSFTTHMCLFLCQTQAAHWVAEPISRYEPIFSRQHDTADHKSSTEQIANIPLYSIRLLANQNPTKINRNQAVKGIA